MNDYMEVRIGLTPCSEDITDVAAALLADAGFESFVPEADALVAYIRKDAYTPECEQALDAMPFDCTHTWTVTMVEGRDWNHEWEKNYFKPIVVADKCVIHSSFHTDIPECDYDIVIDPRMAFGTGHHSTTWLIISRLLELELEGKAVIDMGTGTGILAILAAMRGAAPVAGIEIDEPAYLNALDNKQLNNHDEINILLGDCSRLDEVGFKADVLVANINRNVITADLPAYSRHLAPGARVLLSGFYVEDIPVVEEVAKRCGLRMEGFTERKNWACMSLASSGAVVACRLKK